MSAGRAQTVRFGKRLTVADFEESFKESAISAHRKITNSDNADVVCFRLDEVEFCEIGALARILLTIDRFVSCGYGIEVVLPDVENQTAPPGTNQRRRINRNKGGVGETAYRIEARSRASAFMRHAGFISSLHAEIWPAGAVRIIEHRQELDISMPKALDQVKTQKYDDYRLNNIFPLTWIQPTDGKDLRQSELFLSVVLGLHRRIGLSEADARLLGDAVMGELIENVARHAFDRNQRSNRYALVGAVLLSNTKHVGPQTTVSHASGEYMAWLRRSTSPILRMIVGDAGVGLNNKLGPVREELSHKPEMLVTGSGATSELQTILYAFDRSSTSDRLDGARKKGTRGLWRLSNLVRTYRGSVMVRTGHSIGGAYFGPTAAGTPSGTSELGGFNGTILEVDILTDSVRPRPISTQEDVTPSSRRYRSLYCEPDTIGLSGIDAKQIEHEIDAAVRSGDRAGVIVSMNSTAGALLTNHLELRDGLDLISRMSHPKVPLIVVLADGDPVLVDAAVQSVNLELRHSNTPIWDLDHSPILVLDRYGGGYWCGTNEKTENILDYLQNADNILSLDIAADGGVVGVSQNQETLDIATSFNGVFEIKNGNISTILSTRSAIPQVAKAVEKELRNRIQKGSQKFGVSTGNFLTPTLSRSNRWVDSRVLIAHTVGYALCAFSISCILQKSRVLEPYAGSELSLLSMSGVPNELSRRLSDCLGLGGAFINLPAELDFQYGSLADKFSHGSKVLILSDIVNSANSVSNAIATVVGHGAEPIAIACVIDGRRNRLGLRLLNRDIQIFSVVGKNLEIDSNTANPLQEIDPALRRPYSRPPAVAAPWTLSADNFLDVCANIKSALMIGHLEGGSGKHFTAYPNFGVFLKDAIGIEYITQLAIGAASDFDYEIATTVWYPGAASDFAGQMAVVVGSALQSLGYSVLEPVSIPRARTGNRWKYPETIESIKRPVQVLIVDWGTMTSATIQQLIRLAGNSGASKIGAAIALCEMPFEEAMAVRMIKSVSVSTDSNQSEQYYLPITNIANAVTAGVALVNIKFLAEFPIEGFAANLCPVCISRQRYLIDSEVTPRILCTHGSRVADLMAVKRLDDRTTEGLDLFGVQINDAENGEFIRWRALLNSALGDTAIRNEVLGKLYDAQSSTPDGKWGRNSLLRLLASEPQWLKLPPLRFSQGREGLAALCVDAIRSGDGYSSSEWMQIQAINVLSSAMPGEIVKFFSAFFEITIGRTNVQRELIFQLYHLIWRPPEDSPVSVALLRPEISKIRSLMSRHDNQVIEDGYHLALDEIEFAAARLTRVTNQSTQGAWSALADDFTSRVERHDLEASWTNVIGYLEDLEQLYGRIDDDGTLTDRIEDLNKCMTNLSHAVAGIFPDLSVVFSSRYYADIIGPADHEKLVALCGPAGNSELQKIRADFENVVNASASRQFGEWNRLRLDLLSRMRWWQQYMMSSHRIDSYGPSFVIEFVREMPFTLGPVLSIALQRSGTADRLWYDADTEESRVFCPPALLAEVLDHIRTNAEIRHRIPGVECIFRTNVRRSQSGMVVISVRNSGSRPSSLKGGGFGLERYSMKLRSFGGKIEGRTVASNSWTYQVDISLVEWIGSGL